MRFKNNLKKLMVVKSQNSAYLWGRYRLGKDKRKFYGLLEVFYIDMSVLYKFFALCDCLVFKNGKKKSSCFSPRSSGKKTSRHGEGTRHEAKRKQQDPVPGSQLWALFLGIPCCCQEELEVGREQSLAQRN